MLGDFSLSETEQLKIKILNIDEETEEYYSLE